MRHVFKESSSFQNCPSVKYLWLRIMFEIGKTFDDGSWSTCIGTGGVYVIRFAETHKLLFSLSLSSVIGFLNLLLCCFNVFCFLLHFRFKPICCRTAMGLRLRRNDRRVGLGLGLGEKQAFRTTCCMEGE